MDLIRRAQAEARRLLRRGHGGLTRVDSPVPLPPQRFSTFYLISPSCQIPTLGFLYELFLGQLDDGMFVEVGAYDGYSFSTTSCLVSAGWRGIFIEAVPAFAEACRMRYAANDRIVVANTVIGDTVGEVEIFVGGPYSTTSHETLIEFKNLDWSKSSYASDEGPLVVPQTTLDRLLDEQGVNTAFDVLVVDVEGNEVSVFDGFDLQSWCPRMIIVELADTHPDLRISRDQHARLSRKIVDRDYAIVYKDMINTVFVRNDLVDSTYRLGRDVNADA